VIPQHKGMKELEEKRTVQAQEYWIFRNVQSIISMLSELLLIQNLARIPRL
jgi:hypothetical protein